VVAQSEDDAGLMDSAHRYDKAESHEFQCYRATTFYWAYYVVYRFVPFHITVELT